MRNEKELIGKRTFTAEEIKEILDGIFSGISQDKRDAIEKILKPQFRAWYKIKFPDWIGTILDVSMYAIDPTRMEIKTTAGFYDVVDLEQDVPHLIVPLEMME